MSKSVPALVVALGLLTRSDLQGLIAEESKTILCFASGWQSIRLGRGQKYLWRLVCVDVDDDDDDDNVSNDEIISQNQMHVKIAYSLEDTILC
jgi:hypothetical protein